MLGVADGGAPASTSAAAVAGEEPIATPAPPIHTPQRAQSLATTAHLNGGTSQRFAAPRWAASQ